MMPILGFRAAIFTWIGLLSICPLFENQSAPEPDKNSDINDSKNIEKQDQFLQWAIRCKDSVIEPVERSWERYLEYSGRSDKFETLPSFVYTIDPGHYSDCERALSSSDSPNLTSPRLLSLLKDTIHHARYFAQLTRKIATEEKNTNDEDVHQEITLPDHQSIRAAYSKWKQSNGELDTLINQTKQINDTALLQQWASTKSDLEYRTKAVMIQARLFLRCIVANSNSLSQCTLRQQKFDSTWKEFSNSLSEHHEQAEQVFWMQTFSEDLESYVQCTHNLLHRSKDIGRRIASRSLCQREYATLLRDESTLDFSFP